LTKKKKKKKGGGGKIKKKRQKTQKPQEKKKTKKNKKEELTGWFYDKKKKKKTGRGRQQKTKGYEQQFLWNMKRNWNLNVLSTIGKQTHGSGMKTFSSITEQTSV